MHPCAAGNGSRCRVTRANCFVQVDAYRTDKRKGIVRKLVSDSNHVFNPGPMGCVIRRSWFQRRLQLDDLTRLTLWSHKKAHVVLERASEILIWYVKGLVT